MNRRLILIISFFLVLFFYFFIVSPVQNTIHGKIVGGEDLELQTIGKEILNIGWLKSFGLGKNILILGGIVLIAFILLLIWFIFKNKEEK